MLFCLCSPGRHMEAFSSCALQQCYEAQSYDVTKLWLKFRHKNNLVRFRERSWFGFKYVLCQWEHCRRGYNNKHLVIVKTTVVILGEKTTSFAGLVLKSDVHIHVVLLPTLEVRGTILTLLLDFSNTDLTTYIHITTHSICF